MANDVFSYEQKDSLEVLRFLVRNAKTILIAWLCAVMLTVIFTFSMDKEYFSSATIFPTNANTLESSIENPQFGYDIEADRLIQLLHSSDLKDSIVKKFDLINYYHLDTTQKTWTDDLKKRFYSNVQFSRTTYMSIIISAQTKSPELSANIVNEIIRLANGVRSRILKRNVYEAYTTLEKEFLKQNAVVDSLVNKIFNMRNSNNNPSLVLLQNQRFNINVDKNITGFQNSTYIEQAINEYTSEQTSLNDIRMKYEKARNTFFRPLPSVYVVERAFPSYRKAFPSYVTNIAVVSIFILFCTCGIIFIKERISSMK